MSHDGPDAARILRGHLTELTALHERLAEDPGSTPQATERVAARVEEARAALAKETKARDVC